MIYIIATIVLLIAAQLYYKLAAKFNIIDKPNERSSHTTPTIRGGGIIFLFSVLLFFIISDYQFPYLILGIISIATISFIDDLITLGFKIRLCIQFISAFLILYQIQELIPEPYFFGIILLIACVGVINIYNFMDGINGITGLVSLASLVGFLSINNLYPIIKTEFIVFPIISIIIFGFYNFRKKALFFAGDVGSISMAIIVVFLTLYFSFTLESPIILLLISVYLTDGIITIINRLLKKENIFKPHKTHLYQLLTQKTKLTHLQVSLVYSLLQLILIAPIIFLLKESITSQLLGLLIIGTTLMLIRMYVSKKITSKNIIYNV